MSRMLEDYTLDREILGAYGMAIDLGLPKDEAIRKTCRLYPIMGVSHAVGA